MKQIGGGHARTLSRTLLAHAQRGPLHADPVYGRVTWDHVHTNPPLSQVKPGDDVHITLSKGTFVSTGTGGEMMVRAIKVIDAHTFVHVRLFRRTTITASLAFEARRRLLNEIFEYVLGFATGDIEARVVVVYENDGNVFTREPINNWTPEFFAKNFDVRPRTEPTDTTDTTDTTEPKQYDLQSTAKTLLKSAMQAARIATSGGDSASEGETEQELEGETEQESQPRKKRLKVATDTVMVMNRLNEVPPSALQDVRLITQKIGKGDEAVSCFFTLSEISYLQHHYKHIKDINVAKLVREYDLESANALRKALDQDRYIPTTTKWGKAFASISTNIGTVLGAMNGLLIRSLSEKINVIIAKDELRNYHHDKFGEMNKAIDLGIDRGVARVHYYSFHVDPLQKIEDAFKPFYSHTITVTVRPFQQFSERFKGQYGSVPVAADVVNPLTLELEQEVFDWLQRTHANFDYFYSDMSRPQGSQVAHREEFQKLFQPCYNSYQHLLKLADNPIKLQAEQRHLKKLLNDNAMIMRRIEGAYQEYQKALALSMYVDSEEGRKQIEDVIRRKKEQEHATREYHRAKIARLEAMGLNINEHCFAGACTVERDDGTFVRVEEVQVHDRLRTHGGFVAVAVIKRGTSEQRMCDMGGGLLLTHKHPVFHRGRWVYPRDVCAVTLDFLTTYNFEMAAAPSDKQKHTLYVCGRLCATLGFGEPSGEPATRFGEAYWQHHHHIGAHTEARMPERSNAILVR